MIDLHFGNMKEEKTYYFPASDSVETILVRKKGDVIVTHYNKNTKKTITIRIPIEIIHLLKGYEKVSLEDLTITFLSKLSFDLYEIYYLDNLPKSIKEQISIKEY